MLEKNQREPAEARLDRLRARWPPPSSTLVPGSISR